MNCPSCSMSTSELVKYPNSEVYICKNCGLNFIDAQQKKEYYDGFHKEYEHYQEAEDAKRDKQYNLHAQFIQDIVNKGTVLDVGCSSGKLLSLLANNNELKLYGIDPDSSAIKFAQEKFGNSMDLRNLELKNIENNIKFDGIIFRGTFQYLGFDLKETLEKIVDITNAGSKIIILSLPNADSLLYHILGEKWHLYRKLEHVLIFNHESIIHLAKNYGYKINHLSYPYLETPYANIKSDYKNLQELIKNGKNVSFPFWGNLMQVVLEKI